jgi:ligand-binding SRPBCC domain-containing protein
VVTFVYSSLIDAPVADVWAFHERPDAMQLLTPPDTPLVIEKRTGGLEIGARVDFRVTHLKLHWIAEHTEYVYQQLFADRQVEGPFRSWYHRHRFAAEGQATRLTDEVEFSLPGAPLTDWLAGWAVKIQLKALFRYRHSVTRIETESKS